jgi:hypothetical protein
VANVLIDRYLPKWDVRERHEMAIQTSPEQAYRAVTDLDLGRSRLNRILFTIKGLPRKKAMTLDTLKSVGFVVLEEVHQPRSSSDSWDGFGGCKGDFTKSRPPNSLLSLILAL